MGSTPLVDIALATHRGGVSILPVDCRSKKPAGWHLPKNADGTHGWKCYQSVPADEGTIRGWFKGSKRSRRTRWFAAPCRATRSSSTLTFLVSTTIGGATRESYLTGFRPSKRAAAVSRSSTANRRSRKEVRSSRGYRMTARKPAGPSVSKPAAKVGMQSGQARCIQRERTTKPFAATSRTSPPSPRRGRMHFSHPPEARRVPTDEAAEGGTGTAGHRDTHPQGQGVSERHRQRH